MTDTKSAALNQVELERIASLPRYVALVRRRWRLAWLLTGIMLTIYFGYVLLIAFRPDVLARPLAGGTTTLGIPLGIGVILAGIFLTAVYVRRANGEFDRETAALLGDAATQEKGQ